MFIDLSAVRTVEVVVIGLVTVVSVGGVKILYAIYANKVAACATSMNREGVARKTAGSALIAAGGYLVVKA